MTHHELPGDTLRRLIGSYRDLTVPIVGSDTHWGIDTVYNLQSVSVTKQPGSWRLAEFPFERFLELAETYPDHLGPHTLFHSDFHLAFVRQSYYKGFGAEALEADYVPPRLVAPTMDEMQEELTKAGMKMDDISGESPAGMHGVQDIRECLSQMEQIVGRVTASIAQLRSALPPIVPGHGDMRSGTANSQLRMTSIFTRRVALSVLAARARHQEG